MPFLSLPSLNTIAWIIPISILFGLAAAFFFTHYWGALFSKNYTYPPLRPLWDCIASAIYFTGATKYLA
jgi:hypothetical protein